MPFLHLAREVNQEALQDIAMPAQMRAPHPAGLVGVRERTLDALATSAHQALAAGAPNAPTIRIDGRLGLPRLGPIAAASIRLGDIRPDADGLQIHHDLITVIALVRDQRGERLGVVHLGLRILDLVSGGDRRVANGRRIPRVCALHGHRDDRAGVEVHGMFDLVGQMRAAVFHLGDLRIRIDGAPPGLVRCRLLPLPVQAGEVVARRGGNARRLRQAGQIGLVVLAGVPPHDAPHRRVRLQRGGVDPDRRALQHARAHAVRHCAGATSAVGRRGSSSAKGEADSKIRP